MSKNAEAELIYGPNEANIKVPGSFVRCAVSGKPIPLDELRYWNVELQEPYASPNEAMKRWKELNSEKLS